MLHRQFIFTFQINKKNSWIIQVWQNKSFKKKEIKINLLEVGFEPTHPKITELKSAALDHSATQALQFEYKNKKKSINK